VITAYINEALERARYEQLEDGSYCATVPGLRGVIAIGRRLEECRDDLSSVVEDWGPFRVANGLAIPRLGKVTIRVQRAG